MYVAGRELYANEMAYPTLKFRFGDFFPLVE